MNVLFVGRTVYSFPLAVSLERKWRRLAEKNDLTIIARSTGLAFHKRKVGAVFYLLPHLPVEFLDAALFTVLAYLLGLYLACRKRVQVLDAEDPFVSGFASLVLRETLGLFGKPPSLVVECHGDWRRIHALYRRRLFPGLVNAFADAVARFVFRRATAIRTVSRQLERQIIDAAPGKPVHVFPAFVDIDLFLRQKPVSSNTVLFVGSLYPLKGVLHLLDAMHEIGARVPKARLAIVGRGPQERELRGRANALSLAGRIEFKGELPSEALVHEYAAAACLVLPSLSEGLPRVVVEAMACGKPVVATRVGGVPELVEDGVTGYLIRPGDCQALANRLLQVLAHPAEAQAMGEKARDFIATRFSEATFYERFNALWQAAAEAAGL